MSWLNEGKRMGVSDLVEIDGKSVKSITITTCGAPSPIVFRKIRKDCVPVLSAHYIPFCSLCWLPSNLYNTQGRT